jgi:hypothetical protein
MSHYIFIDIIHCLQGYDMWRETNYKCFQMIRPCPNFGNFQVNPINIGKYISKILIPGRRIAERNVHCVQKGIISTARQVTCVVVKFHFVHVHE